MFVGQLNKQTGSQSYQTVIYIVLNKLANVTQMLIVFNCRYKAQRILTC